MRSNLVIGGGGSITFFTTQLREHPQNSLSTGAKLLAYRAFPRWCVISFTYSPDKAIYGWALHHLCLLHLSLSASALEPDFWFLQKGKRGRLAKCVDHPPVMTVRICFSQGFVLKLLLLRSQGVGKELCMRQCLWNWGPSITFKTVDRYRVFRHAWLFSRKSHDLSSFLIPTASHLLPSRSTF